MNTLQKGRKGCVENDRSDISDAEQHKASSSISDMKSHLQLTGQSNIHKRARSNAEKDRKGLCVPQ